MGEKGPKEKKKEEKKKGLRNELARDFSKLDKAFLEGRDLLRLWRCGPGYRCQGGERRDGACNVTQQRGKVGGKEARLK